MNYLFTGNPLDDVTPAHGYSSSFPEFVFKAKIFDRKKCVAGLGNDEAGYLKIYLNNIDVKSIGLVNKFIKGEWIKILTFSGHPFVTDFDPQNYFFWLGFRTNSVADGKSTKASIRLGKSQIYDNDRIFRALRLLYSKHCTGQKQKSAF